MSCRQQRGDLLSARIEKSLLSLCNFEHTPAAIFRRYGCDYFSVAKNINKVEGFTSHFSSLDVAKSQVGVHRRELKIFSDCQIVFDSLEPFFYVSCYINSQAATIK